MALKAGGLVINEKKKKPNLTDVDLFNPPTPFTDLLDKDKKQSIGTPEQINPPKIKQPRYPGEVVTQEFFSPSAKKILPSGGFRDPRPELGEQVIGTSPAIEQQIEQQRLLETQTPERVELDPERLLIEKIPFAGSFVAAGKTLGTYVKNKLGFETIDQERFDPASFRTAALAAIAKEEIDKGLSINEVLGAYIEALPFGDSVLGVSFAKTLEQPSDNAREVRSNINKIKRQISNIETNVKTGYLPVETAQEQIGEMEVNLVRLESRLKLLINSSPSLKFNSDQVNTMETEILVVREKMLQSKLNILAGKTQDPDELSLLLKIRALEDGGEELE